MEKLVNMQMPVQTAASVKTEVKQAKKTDKESSTGFDKLLKQQKETKENPKDVKKADSDPKEPKSEAPKAEEEQPQESASELAAQLLAQQAAAQSLVTEWEENVSQEMPLVMAVEETVPEGVTEEVKAEAAMPEILEVGELPETDKTDRTVKAEEPKTAKAQQTEAEAPVESARTGEDIPKVQSAQTESSSDESASEKTAVRQTENLQEDTQAVDEQEEQTGQEKAYGVQTGSSVNHMETLHTSEKTEETVLKTTVEDLPQELGKALTAQRNSGGNTLTVELEPASLGKLTIRVEYEAGRAAVSVMASNPKTLELLSEKAGEIASILKERTGEETVIYTHQPEREPGEDSAKQNGSQGGQEQRHEHREEKREETDSFAQQLRLGLI